MNPSGPESQLRSVIAEGLTRLDEAQGGRYLSTVARHLGVERSTVSRWRQQQATARPDHCEMLAHRWPDYFKRDELLDLHYRSLQTGLVHDRRTVGLEILSDTGTVLDASTAELLAEPESANDRVIDHTALHIDRIGRDPIENDSLFGADLAAKLRAFRTAETRRAEQGWTIRAVVSAGKTERLASITAMVTALDGPNVEIFAYPHSLPLVIAPLVIANRTVLMTHDHRRWERPGAALLIRSRAAATWAGHYFSELIADAPFRLRNPSGVDRAELDRYRRALDHGRE